MDFLRGHKNLIFGIRTVIEALRSDKEVQVVYIRQNLHGPQMGELRKALKESGVPSKQIPAQAFQKVKDRNHQGVLAALSPISYTNLEWLLPSLFEQGKTPLVLVLDGITDIRNFGAICRSASCFGVDAVVIPSKGSAMINDVAVKASAGAIHHIPVCRVNSLRSTLSFLKESGLFIAACSERGNALDDEVDFNIPLAVVMGAEDTGISHALLEMANLVLRIPIQGPIASLNVSVASGIILNRIFSQRKMQLSDKYFFTFLLTVLLAVNAIVRFYDVGEVSLSNDELSAVFRLNYNSLGEFITKGIMATDPHPAGVQVFLYFWTAIFGKSVLALRFPFIICGLISLLVLFLVFKDWFDYQPALLTVAFLSFLEIITVHGQLARPYPMAFMFTSLFALAWTKYIRHERSGRTVAFLYIFSATSALYSHYFAGLFCGIVALAGIPVVLKLGKFRNYAVLNLTVLLLFAPHWPITYHQLSRNALVSWIPPTEDGFIWTHIYSVLNGSELLLWTFVAIAILSVVSQRHYERSKVTFALRCLAFFLIPIFAGSVYEYFKGPVLLDRVLVFSVPYLIALPFVFFPPLPRWRLTMAFVLISSVVLGSTLTQTGFRKRMYTENFKKIAAEINSFERLHPHDEIIVTGNFNSPDYINYYSPSKPIEFRIDKSGSDPKLAEYIQLVGNSRAQFLIHSWACVYQPIEALEYAKLKFGGITDEKYFYNSGILILSKTGRKREPLLFQSPDNELAGTQPSADTSCIGCWEISAGDEFINLYSDEGRRLQALPLINTLVSYSGDKTNALMLVLEIKNQLGEHVLWKGKNLGDFRQEVISDVIISARPPEDLSPDDAVKIYLWNPEGEILTVRHSIVFSFPGSAYTGLY